MFMINLALEFPVPMFLCDNLYVKCEDTYLQYTLISKYIFALVI